MTCTTKENIPACIVVVPPIVRRIKHAMNNNQRSLVEKIVEQHKETHWIDVNYIINSGWQVVITCKKTGIENYY